MATNIEMNILKSDGSYEVLYPKTLGSLVSGKVSSATNADSATSATTADGLSSTLAVTSGGTGQTSQIAALGNLIYNATNLASGSITTSTRIGATTGSTAGKYITISNLMTYIQNNLSVSGGVKATKGVYTGTGSSGSITTGFSTTYLIIVTSFLTNPITPFTGVTVDCAVTIGIPNVNANGNLGGGLFSVGGQSITNSYSYFDAGRISLTTNGVTFTTQRLGIVFTQTGQTSGWVAFGE